MTTLPKPTFDYPPTDLYPILSEASQRPALLSVMIGRLLDILRYKFSSTENIYRDELKHLIWKADTAQTGILILPGFETADSNQQADMFPRIVLSAGQLQLVPAYESISHGQMTNGDGQWADGKFHNGSSHYAAFEGVVTIKAVSRGSLEALLIAEDIFMWLLTLRTTLEKDLTLSSCEVSVVNGPKASEAYKGSYEAGVPLKWSSGMYWRVVPEGPPFADLS